MNTINQQSESTNTSNALTEEILQNIDEVESSENTVKLTDKEKNMLVDIITERLKDSSPMTLKNVKAIIAHIASLHLSQEKINLIAAIFAERFIDFIVKKNLEKIQNSTHNSVSDIIK